MVEMLVTPTITSEDLAYVLQALPGAYVFISHGMGITVRWVMVAAPACCTTPAMTLLMT